VQKYGRAGQVPHDNMPPVQYTLDTQGYKQTQYLILTAFPRQQWLRQLASMLGYTYIRSISYWS